MGNNRARRRKVAARAHVRRRAPRRRLSRHRHSPSACTQGLSPRRIKAPGARTARELQTMPNGARVRVAGAVICRQRPGTAKGFVFLSMEDETGIANAILTPDIFDEYHVTIVHKPFLLIDGRLQNQDGVVSVKVERVEALSLTARKPRRTIFTEVAETEFVRKRRRQKQPGRGGLGKKMHKTTASDASKRHDREQEGLTNAAFPDAGPVAPPGRQTSMQRSRRSAIRRQRQGLRSGCR